MILNFKTTPTFDRKRKRFSKKYKSFDNDFDQFIDEIENCRYTDLGNNIRKYRLAIRSKQKGKSGGLRVITLDILVAEDEKDITFILVYDKSEHSNITNAELKRIIKTEL